MTVKEGAIISAYTGVMCCETFKPVHEYIEHILGRPVLIHEIPWDEVKVLAKPDFEAIVLSQT